MENMIYHLHFFGRSINRSGKKFFFDAVELIRYLEPIINDSFLEVCKRKPSSKAGECVENSFVVRIIDPEILPEYTELFKEKRITKKKIEFNEVFYE